VGRRFGVAIMFIEKTKNHDFESWVKKRSRDIVLAIY
jgi:hypothetical protein